MTETVAQPPRDSGYRSIGVVDAVSILLDGAEHGILNAAELFA